MKKKTAKTCIIILICIAILGAAGFVAYQKLFCGIHAKIDLSNAKIVDTSDKPFTNVIEQWEDMGMEDYVIRCAQQIGNSWRDAQQVWSGADYTATQLVIAMTDKSCAWLIEPNGTLYQFDFDMLPAEYKENLSPTVFRSAADQINGQPTAFMVWDTDYFSNKSNMGGEFEALPDNTMMFVYVTHEEFHHQQDSWKIKTKQEEMFKACENRSAEAIIMRHELVDNLLKAYMEEENEADYLSAAKWWQEQYNEEFPEEAALVYPFDIIEGTARYFDMAMNVRSKYGVNADSTTIEQAYRDILTLDHNLSGLNDQYADSEAYDLGGVSCVLLERQGIPDWQKTITENKISPAELLLKDVVPVEQTPSTEIIEQVNEILGSNN